jgi:hypothetical protein
VTRSVACDVSVGLRGGRGFARRPFDIEKDEMTDMLYIAPASMPIDCKQKSHCLNRAAKWSFVISLEADLALGRLYVWRQTAARLCI